MENTRILLVKMLKAMMRSKGNPPGAHAYSLAQYGPHSMVTKLLSLKMMDSPDIFADDAFKVASDGFLMLMKPNSPIQQINDISAWRRTPAFTRVLKQTAGATAAFVGEAQAIITSDAALEETRLPIHKIAGIVLTTNELAMLVGDDADAVLARDLARATALVEGAALFDPAQAGSESQPASLTHGCVTIQSSGTTPEAIMYDLSRLFDGYQGDLSRSVLVMNQATALPLSLLGPAIGAQGMSAGAQTWLTLPLVYCQGMAAGDVALIDPSGTMMTPTAIDLDTSEQATVQINDDEGGSSLVSLWQMNLQGIRSVEYIAWEVAREDSVRLLTGLTFPAPKPPASTKTASKTAAA